MESGSHFSFFWWSEPGTGALWRVDSTFLFFGCLNLEQVLGRAYRKCGGSTWHFSFFWGSEPGTGARPSLQKMWRVDRTFFFLWCLFFEQVPVRAYRNCGGWIALFFFFLGCGSEPGTGALWRVDRTFLFFGWSEPRAGAGPSLQKMWRVDRTFLFFGCLNLEQVPGRAYRKCGERETGG